MFGSFLRRFKTMLNNKKTRTTIFNNKIQDYGTLKKQSKIIAKYKASQHL